MGEDENFWPASAPSQGPDGVCGPCSEIFYQARRQERGRDLEPGLHAVQPRRAIRRTICGRCRARTSTPAWAWSGRPSVLQGVDTNFHIDILRPIVEAAGEVCGVKYDPAERERPPAAAHRRSRAGLHVRHSRKRLSRAEQGEVRRQAAAAPGRARRPADGRARAVPAQARADGGRDDAQALSRAGRDRRPAWRR